MLWWPGLLIIFAACTQKTLKMEQQARALIDSLEKQLVPISTSAAIAAYDAAVSGLPADYEKTASLELELNKLLTNKEVFAQLKVIKESGKLTDTLLVRQVDLLYLAYLSRQIDTALLEQLINKQSAIEQVFSTFRAEVDGKQVGDNTIDSILKNSVDQRLLQEVWTASKAVGAEVNSRVVELVKLRNKVAQSLGFPNYHYMSLALSEQDPDEILALFDELDSLTAPAYAQLKGSIDSFLSKRFSINADELKPWHYQNRFFQEPPQIYPVNLDRFFAGQNLEQLATVYYAGLGLDVADIMSRSDLYEKPGKNQHAFCTDIDRSGDVRMLCNLRPDAYWANTLLHELGHAVYSKYNDPQLPYLLRNHAHTFTTEAIANLFGRFASHPDWLVHNGLTDSAGAEAIRQSVNANLRLEQLVFSRWCQVMYRFEKAMFENPDQDLNTLWWQLVEKYQLLKKPVGRNQPDWASKIHVALYPCYYHNYLMGELLASQLHHHISVNVLGATEVYNQSFTGRPEVGIYLRTKVFEPGARYHWKEMIVRATGEPLSAKYYALQFLGK